ncbi:hypothetical protein ACJRO7_021643 [Eucalyptus globulus]|uniref:DUF4283 domain-containing protein n=1 Tax=Eucalyptus globulus TaxID=34317 RepID=A0ABD3KMZ8_EUCGL
MIEQTLKNIWGSKLVDMLADDQEFYYFHILDPEFRRKILEEGPITVARIPLILQQWKPLMELKKAKQTSVPVWIRLKNLPLDLWSAPTISVIASSVGKPLHVDQRTEGTRMISFARVCVEIQANRPRVSTVEVNVDGVTRSIAVNYEWRPLECSKCGVFGHKCDVAPPPVRPLPAPLDTARPLDQPAETPEDSEQGWKQVKSKKNKAQPLEGMSPSPSEGERSLNLKTTAVEKRLPGTYSRRPPRGPLIISEQSDTAPTTSAEAITTSVPVDTAVPRLEVADGTDISLSEDDLLSPCTSPKASIEEERPTETPKHPPSTTQDNLLALAPDPPPSTTRTAPPITRHSSSKRR